jgi:hypothetical protein
LAKIDFVYLQGKTKWFRHSAPNQWGNWSHDLYIDPPSLEKWKELQTGSDDVLGIKNQLRKDEDGYFVTLRRPVEKQLRSGKKIGFAPPEVLTADGVTPLRGVMVGNGSDVTTKLEVYTHFVPGSNNKKARAIRWLSSKIDNLVPFEINKDFNENEEKQVRGLAEQPAQF